MTYHTGNKPGNKPKKPMKNSNKPMKKSNKLTDKQMEKLKTHSKKHKGGMNSKHMKNMKKFMMSGETFIVGSLSQDIKPQHIFILPHLLF